MKSRRSFLKKISFCTSYFLFPISSFSKSIEAKDIDMPLATDDILDKIINLIKENNADKLAKILKKNPSLSSLRDNRDRSLIWLASLYEKENLFDVLKQNYTMDFFDFVVSGNTDKILEKVKADEGVLNIKNKYGYTPLLAACECGVGASVETLVAVGARMDVALPNEENDTPLTLALKHNNINSIEWMVQILLGNGENPNVVTKTNKTALHIAVQAANLFSIKMLLRKKADPSIKDDLGRRPLDYAKENKTLIENLVNSSNDASKDLYITRFKQKSGGNVTNDNHGLPYQLINDFVTTAHFNLDKTKAYLVKVPDLLFTRTTWDEMAIEGCTHLGNEPLVKYLLEKDAPYSICTATMLGDISTVKQYIQQDSRTLNDKGPHDFPLIWYTAIGKAKIDIAELLIQHGIDINANIRGRTVLSECANRGHADLMDYLLSKGADAKIKSVSSFMAGTPFEIAMRRKNLKVIEVLKKYNIEQ